ncbi:hypothetical protein DFH07DRAFT_959377 [Mycena maculata]|uniref:Uncharacterized protein n=1 Tax=Mycena maculata TaxID=230809 RepID=A0AAD7J2K2_9AGAR|nr:hypothetical protein DFH07DRAFT_959377 [Mycena maculata]
MSISHLVSESRSPGVRALYPPRTAGFFYYHRPKDLPFTAGAIRFRISSVLPSNFPAGRDLLRPDGVPWQVPFPALARSRPILQELLLRDKLITKSELEGSAALFPGVRARGPRTLLHRFDEEFPVVFDGANYIQRCGGDGAAFRIRRALVRFELSTLPEHRDMRVVVLRVVEMITPPTLKIDGYDGYLPPPLQGGLVQRSAPGRGTNIRPWSRKLESTWGKALAPLVAANETD